MKTVLAMTAIALVSASSLVFAADGGPQRGAFLERLKAADTDGNGMISRAEAAALPRLAAHFDAIDTNKDGQLTADELRAFHQAHHGHHGRGGHAKALLGPDGKITRDQFLARAAERFDRMDANKDGVVTADELKAGFQAKRAAKQ